KLVGLDDAVLDFEGSAYFNHDTVATEEVVNEELDAKRIEIPIIINNQVFTNRKINYTYERLDIPFERETADETISNIEEKGGEAYLDTVKGNSAKTFSYTDKEVYNRMVNSYAGIDVSTGDTYSENYIRDTELSFQYRASPLLYQQVQSPYADKWQYAYELEVIPGPGRDWFREPNVVEVNEYGALPTFYPYFVGFYDPGKLDISMDPLTELPMETYRPSTAELVVD